MGKLKNSWIYSLIIIAMIVLLTTRCKKEDTGPVNPYNGKTSAVFNPDLTYGTMTDQDGNIYKTIKIGTQTWMAENLRVKTYNDSSAILNVPGTPEWISNTTGAWCAYNNTTNADTISTYGLLYNWPAVSSGKLAPRGWHIPSNDDWTTLISSQGDIRNEQHYRIEGGKLKEIDTTHWSAPNTYATNITGFTALPGGGRF